MIPSALFLSWNAPAGSSSNVSRVLPSPRSLFLSHWLRIQAPVKAADPFELDRFIADVGHANRQPPDADRQQGNFDKQSAPAE